RLVQSWREADDGWPYAAMHERNVAVDEPRDQDVRRIAHAARDTKDVPAARVRPPGAADAAAGDRFGEIGNRSARSFQHHPMLLAEAQRSLECHGRSRRAKIIT